MAESVAASPPPVLMTVAGPLSPADVLAEDGPALGREWLLNDQSALLKRPVVGVQTAGSGLETDVPDGQPRPSDRVELGTLMSMRRWPLASLHNLHLSYADALGELSGPLKRRHRGAALVVACTPRVHCAPAAAWERAVALRTLSQEAGAHIIVGTAPAPGCPASDADFATEVARLVSDLAVGFEMPPKASASGLEPEGVAERVRPGFLGELVLWDHTSGPPLAADILALRACVEAQRRTEAALFMSGPVSTEVLAILDGSAGPPGPSGPCLWGRCVFFDVPLDSPVQPAQLVARGAFLGFCPPPAACDIAWQSYPSRRPWRTEEQFLAALAAAPPDRVLISSGIRFRTDLVAFGGQGLAHAHDLIVSAGGTLGKVGGTAAFRAAAVSVLQYPWRPPPPPEKVVHMIECHWCGVKKVEGEHFSKQGFDYCTPKCIAKHRQVDFALDKSGRV